MNHRARRRADPPARLTTQLNRERGTARELSRRIPATTPRPAGRSEPEGLPGGIAPRAPVDGIGLGAPLGGVGLDAPAGGQRLVSRWTTNAAGRLVMVWSLEPVVEAAPAIWLSARLPAAARP